MTARLRPMIVALAALAAACGEAGGMSGPMPSRALMAPSGLPELSDQAWDAVSTGEWRYLRRTSAKDADIVEDPDAPMSPARVLRMIFTPDMKRDTEPGVHWIGLPESREVHVGWWIKLSPNWTASPAGACKMTFLWASPNRAGQVYTALYGSSAPHHVGINTEWMPYGQKVWDPNISATPIEYGRWYRIDWYARWPASPQAANGVMRWWVDGVLNGNHIDVKFPPAGTGFQQFEFAPTVQVPPPAEQYIYIDHSFVRAR